MTELEKKQDELIEELTRYTKTHTPRSKQLKAEIAALKQGEPESAEKECYNCKDKVKMISRGEFCPSCMCDQ